MNSEDFENILIQQKKSFIVKISNLNKLFLIDGKRYEVNLMPFRNFSLIKKVEKEAKEFLKNNKIPENLKIKYIKEPKEKIFFKIDIKAAYWYAAGKLFLTKKTFEEGLKGRYSKLNRLIALGSLASRNIIKIYEKGNLITETIEKKETEKLYFYIASNIDLIMSLSGGGYWVDCAFLKEKEEFCELLESLNYLYSVEKIYSFKKNKNIYEINNKIYNFEDDLNLNNYGKSY